jgi:hypothetical protein
VNLEHLSWALDTLNRRRQLYDLFHAYYVGQHRLAFASQRVQDAFGNLFRAYNLNLCSTVVSTVSDRLHVVGFSTPGAEEASAPETVQRVWERNRMPARHGRVHRDALVMGDAYVSVWQDRAGLVRIYDESPREVIGHQDPEAPGELDYAVKAWRERRRVRVTVYYRDRLERYVTRGETDKLPPPGELRPLEAGDVGPDADPRPEVVNAWGMVPVVPFPRDPGTDGLGTSILRDVLPPQDALNKTVADLLATSEASALPLRYLIGVEAEKDAAGNDRPLFSEARNRVVTLPKGASAGQWDPASLEPILAAKAEHAADVARVARIPVHKLMLVGANDWPSGEALRVAEADLVAQATGLTLEWGPAWSQVNLLASRMAGAAAEVRTLWAPVETPPSEETRATTAEAKLRAGIPRAQVWRELGYSAAQVREFEAAYQEDQERQADVQARTFSAGLPAGTGGF